VALCLAHSSVLASLPVTAPFVTIGFVDAGALVLARANDNIPVKLFTSIYKKPPHALFALADSGIRQPKVPEGKTLADTAFSAIPIIFNQYAALTGIYRSKVKWITVDGSTMPVLLATGRADAVGQFTVGEPLLASVAAPKKVVRLAFKDAGLDYYGNGLVATEQAISENPIGRRECGPVHAGPAAPCWSREPVSLGAFRRYAAARLALSSFDPSTTNTLTGRTSSLPHCCALSVDDN
jgi:NMT1/THI5 like